MFLFLIEITTALFAFSCAWLNAVPVRKMIDYGASRMEEKQFHMANTVVKIFFVAAVLLRSHTHAEGLIASIVLAVILFSIQWFVFDCCLGMMIHRDWFYIGTTAKIDKWLSKLFPHGDGGEVKAIACAVIIIALNILYSYL
jgi:hypothetical protein